MPRSTITLSVTGATLRVQASTQSARTPLQTSQGLTNEVDLSWTDDTGALRETAAGGFGFRIENTGNSSYDYAGSGTTTNNTVMLHDVRVDAAARSQDHVVTFDTAGGSAVDTVTVPAGDAVAQPDDPTRGRDLFAGWFSDTGCRTAYDFGAPVTADLTLTACWETLETVVPAAHVERMRGRTNELTVTVTETWSRGTVREHTGTFDIRNNADGTYDVGPYRVYVETHRLTQVRDVRIVG
jgi:hypothetical protein